VVVCADKISENINIYDFDEIYRVCVIIHVKLKEDTFGCREKY